MNNSFIVSKILIISLLNTFYFYEFFIQIYLLNIINLKIVLFCRTMKIFYNIYTMLNRGSSSLFILNLAKKRLMSSTNTKSKNIQTIKDVPVVKGLPVFGTLFSLLAAGGSRKLHEYIDKRHQQYGSVFREKFGSVDAIWISNPSDIKLIFQQEGKYPQHYLPEAWLLYNETYGQQRGLYFM